MAAAPGTKNKYGVKLKRYLTERGPPQSLRQTRAASDDQIQDAFFRFRNSLPITYETLEIILSMTRSPQCGKLALLISETMLFIPKCIAMLRAQCSQKGAHILSHSYGYLTLHVVTLAIQVFKVLVSQLFGFFLDETKMLPPSEPIRPIFEKFIGASEQKWFERGTSMWQLWWGFSPDVGQKMTLGLVGGFTLPDALFLIEQLWTSRKEFLYAAAWGSKDFLGWSGLIHMLWSIVLQAEEAEPSSVPRVTVESRHWVALGDIICRYALCDLDESEDLRMALITQDVNFLGVISRMDSSTVVDTADLNTMIALYSKKIKSTSTMYLDNYMETLLTYILPNTDRGYEDFSYQLSRVLRPLFDRIWDEYLPPKIVHDQRRWSSVVSPTSNVVLLLVGISGAYPSQNVGNTILSTVTSEEFYELLGRLILYPVTEDGKKLLG